MLKSSPGGGGAERSEAEGACLVPTPTPLRRATSPKRGRISGARLSPACPNPAEPCRDRRFLAEIPCFREFTGNSAFFGRTISAGFALRSAEFGGFRGNSRSAEQGIQNSRTGNTKTRNREFKRSETGSSKLGTSKCINRYRGIRFALRALPGIAAKVHNLIQKGVHAETRREVETPRVCDCGEAALSPIDPDHPALSPAVHLQGPAGKAMVLD
jgi:hypothetical protein